MPVSWRSCRRCSTASSPTFASWSTTGSRCATARSRSRARCDDAPPPTVARAEVDEAATFLEWLADDNFTFEGYCEYDLVEHEGEDALHLVAGSQLGVVRRRRVSEYSRTFASMAPETRRKGREPWVLTLTKTQARSTVHRAVPLDYVGVKRFDADGNVVGECRFTGLYTSTVYTESTHRIPVVRRKVAEVIADSGLPTSGHDGRALANILETYPRDELFRLSVQELGTIAQGILRMGQRRSVRLFASRDEFGRFVSCLVYLPRDRYTTTTRVGIVFTLRRAFQGTAVDFTVLVTESLLARLHVIVDTPDPMVAVDIDALEADLGRIARAWVDDLREALIAARGEEAGLDTFRAYANAFLPSYQEDVRPSDAVDDIAVLEQLDPAGDLQIRIVGPAPCLNGAGSVPERERVATVKLYRSGTPLVLSAVMPVLEHLGLTVVEERPYQVTVAGGVSCWVDTFRVQLGDGDQLDDSAAQARVAELFLGVWAGEIENDSLNRLVVRAGLAVREVVLLRALVKYLRQAGVRFTEAYIADSLFTTPRAARLLSELFHARLFPRSGPQPVPRTESEILDELTREIDAVVALDDDRMLRALLALVQAAVRTNAFAPGGKSSLAIKFDPSLVPFLPAPRPAHEIWVYSRRVEGVHLRAGDIARGGIRWSDRREDFRTEILGLMKAQTAKNSVIVPVGAKGGFVVKEGEGLECYRTFIRGLLDLTDDIVEGLVVHPESVTCLDGDDPYLVVAADKGTATFSDTANELAAEYGFWLDDAFASGGSSGYDHKEMAITARGAWVSVRAHFRARGVDADTAELTVVGVGDMSGDVFGNGVLRSAHIKLVAAFDHRHVFLDPDPDPARSYAERHRLFELPSSPFGHGAGSSWADYDAALISAGGGVFPRTAKSVAGHARSAARARHRGGGTRTRRPHPGDPARARRPLLERRHRDVREGEHRVERRCRRPHQRRHPRRCEPAPVRGVRRGRQPRDHPARPRRVRARRWPDQHRRHRQLRRRRLLRSRGEHQDPAPCRDRELARSAEHDRDPLLRAMTDEVAALVLADNAAQANALEIALVEASALVGVHARQIERLEQTATFDRALEGLPTAKQLQERAAAGIGLTAPELAVLLAYTKLDLERGLVASDLPDDPYVGTTLVDYFPTAVRTRFEAQIRAHRLRREITATVVANAVVNRAGISFVSRLSDETGAPMARITRAHIVARDVFEAEATWDAIDALDLVVPAATQDAMFLAVRRQIERTARRLVQGRDALDLGSAVARYQPGARALVEALPVLLLGTCAARRETDAEQLRSVGVPEPLAARVALAEWLPATLDLVDLAERTHAPVAAVAGTYFALTSALRLDWLRDRIAELPRADRWQTEARAALRDELHDAHRELAEVVLSTTEWSLPAVDRVDAWSNAHALAVQRFLQMLTDIEAAGVFDLTTLGVARRALRELGAIT